LWDRDLRFDTQRYLQILTGRQNVGRRGQRNDFKKETNRNVQEDRPGLVTLTEPQALIPLTER